MTGGRRSVGFPPIKPLHDTGPFELCGDAPDEHGRAALFARDEAGAYVHAGRTTLGDSAYQLYLEDLSVGDRFETGTLRWTRRRCWTSAAFDPQPFHLDDAAARATMFGGLAASGWHTAALTMRLLVGSGPPIAGGIIGGGAEIAWPKPTRPATSFMW